MKSEFISTAAHELTTPLATIVGYSELLLQEPDIAADRCREALSYINHKGWALSRIVDEILNVSRIESGQGIPINRDLHDINEIVRNTVASAKMMSQRHTFETVLPGSPVQIMVDEGKIVQVIENILSNGIKYSPEGGPIMVRGEITCNGYILAICDRGIGMTSEQVAKVFDKFYRADCSNTAIGGTGLGMSIVKHFIEAHGGTVEVESAPGTGTTVCLTLPLEG
jgi:signal transduction histidine kinase